MSAAPATLERAAAKEKAKTDAEKAAQRQAQIFRLEQQFINIEAIRQWVKLQPVNGVLDNDGNQAHFDDVSPVILDSFRIEMVAAMQDKVGAEYDGKVRQGRVTGDRHVVT